MTLLLWIGVIIVVIAAIIKNLKQNVIVLRPGMDPNNPDKPNQDNPFKNGFPPFGPFSKGPFGQPRQGQANNGAEQMVCCEHCNVFIPVSQATKRAGHTFCCQEHAAAWYSSDHSMRP